MIILATANPETLPGIKQYENFIMVQADQSKSPVYAQLPCYPEELSDSQSANWSESNIIGRSSPISAYTSTGYRQVSFSIELHRELCDDLRLGENSSLEQVERVVRRSVYPSYASGRGVAPPITTVKIGAFKARGYVTSYQFTWKKPIVDNKYQILSMSISMVDIDNGNNFVRTVGKVHEQSGSSMNPFGYTFTWSNKTV